ncbi:MAG: hypothetical protein KatS3mg102_2543 [Planctomycetota bacterium]|nr:MAG: hypothetical protein KatS3mg102_2543 [Planctomycetota bacterium]
MVASLLAGAQVQSTEELSAEGRPGRLVRSTGTWPEQAGGPPRRWEAWAVGRPEARYHFVAFGPGRAVEARPEVVRRMAMGMRAVRPSDGGADAGERHSLASDPPAAGGEQGPGGYAGGGTGTSPVTTGAIAPAPRELAQVPFRVSWQRPAGGGLPAGARSSSWPTPTATCCSRWRPRSRVGRRSRGSCSCSPPARPSPGPLP